MKIDQEALAMFRNPSKAILRDFSQVLNEGGFEYAAEVFIAMILAEDRSKFIGNYDKLLEFMNENKELISEIISGLLLKLSELMDNKQ